MSHYEEDFEADTEVRMELNFMILKGIESHTMRRRVKTDMFNSVAWEPEEDVTNKNRICIAESRRTVLIFSLLWYLQ
jgi:hypothetical protein